MIPIVGLMRRYCEEFINARDPGVCADLMVEAYRQRFAGHVFSDRSVYEPLVADLFVKFPDLRITMHEILTDGDRLATRFTLAGSSTRHGGNKAAWGGIALYRWDGRRLTGCWVEEDQRSGREQLRSGVFELPDQAPGPADPFAARPVPPEPGVLETARSWLARGGDGRLGSAPTIDELIVSGRRFAFHTSSATVRVSGMASVGGAGPVTEVSTFSDGGTP
jgi:hypothetical protein